MSTEPLDKENLEDELAYLEATQNDDEQWVSHEQQVELDMLEAANTVDTNNLNK